MKKVLFFIFLGWTLVCGLAVFDINIIDNVPVQAVFGEILDDEKTIKIDFSLITKTLSKIKIVKKDFEITPIIFSQSEIFSIAFQSVCFFILGIILLATFNIFSKYIVYPTLVFGGIIIFLLSYLKIISLKGMFDWVKFYLNYLSLGASTILGIFIKRLKKAS